MAEMKELHVERQRRAEIEAGHIRYEELEQVVDGEEGTFLEWSGGGVGLQLPEDHGLGSGDRVRLYSGGTRCRGLDVWDGDGWEPVLFLTEADIARQGAEWKADLEEKRALEFAERYDDLQRRIGELPTYFRRRIERFRLNNPRFLIEYGEYEMSACEEAVGMVEWARQKASTNGRPASDWLSELRKASYEEQQEMYDFVHDGHSGNTWGMALRLATWTLKDPRWVEVEHGTMVPLVGCEDYGCPPPEDEDWREIEPEILRESHQEGQEP